PDDKPPCWNWPITRGGLRYPREYVGAIGWAWRDDDLADLYVEATPFALLERRRRAPVPDQTWRDLLQWWRDKGLALVRLARLEPRVVGACCPFCPFVLPAGELLNALLEHVAVAHPDLRLQGVTLGDTPLLATDRGDFPIWPAERFE